MPQMGGVGEGAQPGEGAGERAGRVSALARGAKARIVAGDLGAPDGGGGLVDLLENPVRGAVDVRRGERVAGAHGRRDDRGGDEERAEERGRSSCLDAAPHRDVE